MEQLKAAVIADPSLLDTPQAKAAMKEKGITKDDVNKKLIKNEELETKTIEVQDIENRIDIKQTDENNETYTTEEVLVDDTNTTYERLNSFRYKTSQKIREDYTLKNKF